MEAEDLEVLLPELLDDLASAEHERWSHWQRYLHGKCIPHGSEGALLIPAELVRKWERQIATPYAELSELEKESDREQVRKYLPIVTRAIDIVRRRSPG